MGKWSMCFYEDAQGRRPVQHWIERLNDQKAEAVIVALEQVLAVHGIGLTSGAWLRALGGGLYEFRIRHSKAQIQQMYDAAGRAAPRSVSPLLLRMFVAFEEGQLVILLGAYDKGRNDSAGFQQHQIGISRKRLKDWQRRGV